MKTAFVCDWLTGMRGGERCLEVACELFPQADIFTLVHYANAVSKTIESHNIYTSYIQNLPGNSKSFRRYLPLFPNAIQRFDLQGYDCVISFSHCVAKGVNVPESVPHICYCHTPVRYVWNMRKEYLRGMGKVKSKAAGFILDRLKKWDIKTSANVTHFIANSGNVQQRIKQAYNRDSIIIYPPVDCQRFDVCDSDENYYLIVSALVPYKRIDLAVKAFRNLNQKLLIVGNGPELNSLKQAASQNISFVESAIDSEVTEYMEKCKALIFPGEEDFGIVPLEAQACGKPVIAYGKGGALETVIDIKENQPTGIFFDEQTEDSLRNAVVTFENIKTDFDPMICRGNALKFDRKNYKGRLGSYISDVLE